MKKFLLILLTLSMLLSAIPFSVSAGGNLLDSFYESLPPWDDINNYIYYDTEVLHKEGYKPGKITVFMTEEFMSTHEAPVPSDFVDPKNNIYLDENIVDIIHKDYYDYNEFDIIMDWFQEPYMASVEKTIYGYIYTLQDLEFLKIVGKVRPYYVYSYGTQLINFTEVEDYRDYDGYYYYNNEDDHKEEGYITDVILFRVTDEFESFVFDNYSKNEDGYYYLEASLFPEIQDKIKRVRLGTLGNTGTITLENRGEEITDYTKEHIDAFVEILKYLTYHPSVVSVTPNAVLTFEIDPIFPDSEPDETTTDIEEVTTEPITTEPEETTALEITAPETTTGESENTAQKNHQTGDELYFLMAAAVLSFAVVTFVTTLKKRAKIR